MSDLITRITNSVINAEHSAKFRCDAAALKAVAIDPRTELRGEVQDSRLSPDYCRCSDDLCNNPIPVQDAHQCHVDRRPFCEWDYPEHVKSCEACQEAKVRRDKYIGMLAEILSIEAGR